MPRALATTSPWKTQPKNNKKGVFPWNNKPKKYKIKKQQLSHSALPPTHTNSSVAVPGGKALERKGIVKKALFRFFPPSFSYFWCLGLGLVCLHASAARFNSSTRFPRAADSWAQKAAGKEGRAGFPGNHLPSREAGAAIVESAIQAADFLSVI